MDLIIQYGIFGIGISVCLFIIAFYFSRRSHSSLHDKIDKVNDKNTGESGIGVLKIVGVDLDVDLTKKPVKHTFQIITKNISYYGEKADFILQIKAKHGGVELSTHKTIKIKNINKVSISHVFSSKGEYKVTWYIWENLDNAGPPLCEPREFNFICEQ